jgi:hypothetical protein
MRDEPCRVLRQAATHLRGEDRLFERRQLRVINRTMEVFASEGIKPEPTAKLIEHAVTKYSHGVVRILFALRVIRRQLLPKLMGPLSMDSISKRIKTTVSANAVACVVSSALLVVVSDALLVVDSGDHLVWIIIRKLRAIVFVRERIIKKLRVFARDRVINHDIFARDRLIKLDIFARDRLIKLGISGRDRVVKHCICTRHRVDAHCIVAPVARIVQQYVELLDWILIIEFLDEVVLDGVVKDVDVAVESGVRHENGLISLE